MDKYSVIKKIYMPLRLLKPHTLLMYFFILKIENTISAIEGLFNQYLLGIIVLHFDYFDSVIYSKIVSFYKRVITSKSEQLYNPLIELIYRVTTK